MKLAIISEGKNEKIFYNILLERNVFRFIKNDLLLRKIIHCRQIVNDPELIQEIERQKEKIIVYRFGDKLSEPCDKYLSQRVKMKIAYIYDYNVVPEFEILFILKEGLYDKFQKVKNKQKASTFAKIHIFHNKNRYDATAKWIIDYVNDMSNEEIYDMFKLYSLKCSHNSRCKNNILSLLKRI